MNQIKKISAVLKSHKLRNTSIRQNILSVFQNTAVAITPQQIEGELKVEIDRVTLYRTLQKFIEHGIIHQIDDKGQTFYALCTDCELHNHEDNHLHFKCNSCDTIQCVHQKKSVEFDIPKGFQIQSMKILLEGTCNECVNA